MTDIERAVLDLYPNVKAKGLRLKLWYYDLFARKVRIEGDADMQAMLMAFVEAAEAAELDVKYPTLHVEEYIHPHTTLCN